MMPEAIAAAFREACLIELRALKPGNVHIYADGHRMTVADFEASAEAAAPHIAARGAPVGARILGAVKATRERTGQNTNLGIILLCAPLAAAAAMMAKSCDGGELAPPSPGRVSDRVRGEPQAASFDLREALASVLAALDIHDAALAFQAIALANPGGLGTDAEHDVRDAARITLLDAMRAAAHRDHIACQYATGFAGIFDACVSPMPDHATLPAMAERIYWHFLTHIPDSHIVRKFGAETAEDIRSAACDMDRRLAALPEGQERRSLLLGFDSELKSRGINPGTSADLTVAALFANAVQRNLG